MNRRSWYAVLVTVLILVTASVASVPTAPARSPATPAARATGAWANSLQQSLDWIGLAVSVALTLWLVVQWRRRRAPSGLPPTPQPDRGKPRSCARHPRPREGLAQLARRTGLAQDALRLLSSPNPRRRMNLEGMDCRSGKNDRSALRRPRPGPTPELIAALVVSPRIRGPDQAAHGLPVEPSP
jgi:hypothetical protein